MIAHFGADAGAGVGGKDDVRGLVREVAVDALARKRSATAREKAAALNFMARKTTCGEVFHVALGRVHVVTRRARHVRRLETFAALEQRDLVAVNVERVVSLRRFELQVIR